MPRSAPSAAPPTSVAVVRASSRTAARALGVGAVLAASLAGACASGARAGAAGEPPRANAAAPGAPTARAPRLPSQAELAARWDAGARELTADRQVRQALARLTFGARPGDEAAVRAMGVDVWIERQLHPEAIDDRANEARLARALPTLALDAAALQRAHPNPGAFQRRRIAELRAAARARGDTTAPTLSADDSVRYAELRRGANRPIIELATARTARAVGSERQLLEVMTDFWENHFSVYAAKGQPMRYLLPGYDATIRAHALGRFRDLLGAVAKHPAMLFYLDNWTSVADPERRTLADAQRARQQRRAELVRARAAAMGMTAPQQARPRRGLNENYARELLELHTLGVDGGYTQQDVIAVARALTGWTLRPVRPGAFDELDGTFAFRPEAHDAEPKTVLGVQLAAGRGIEDGEQVLDLLARHPSTARFIGRKLCVRFVGDAPPPSCEARAAAAFTRSDGDLRETLRAVLHGPELFAQAAWRAKVKTPLELVASTARALGAAPDTTPRTANLVRQLGQPLWGHQAPDGWPETGAAWMNAGAIVARINFGLQAASGRFPNATPAALDAPPTWASLRTAPAAQQVDGVVAALLGGEASPDTRAILTSGENPLLTRAGAAADAPVVPPGGMRPEPADAPTRADAMRADAMRADAMRADAMRPAARPTPRRLDGLAQLVGLALGSPEFQRR